MWLICGSLMISGQNMPRIINSSILVVVNQSQSKRKKCGPEEAVPSPKRNTVGSIQSQSREKVGRSFTSLRKPKRVTTGVKQTRAILNAI